MTRQAATGAHDLLCYDSDSALVDTAIPFLRAGLAAGESVVLVCDERKNALLAEALGGEDGVNRLAQTEVYRRPSATIAAYTRFVERHTSAGVPRVRVMGELYPVASPDAWAEWIRYESVLNHAFARSPVWILCGYDRRTVPAEAIAGAEATHPNLRSGDSRTGNPRYVEPAEYLRRSGTRGHDPLEAQAPTFQADALTDVSTLRRGLQAALAANGHRNHSVEAIVTAVNEVASNALLYGAPPVQVRFWSTPERSLCTITDGGSGFDDPFAGYLCTTVDAQHGRGLWLARQLCDTVDSSRNGPGFTVRLGIRH